MKILNIYMLFIFNKIIIFFKRKEYYFFKLNYFIEEYFLNKTSLLKNYFFTKILCDEKSKSSKYYNQTSTK